MDSDTLFLRLRNMDVEADLIRGKIMSLVLNVIVDVLAYIWQSGD